MHFSKTEQPTAEYIKVAIAALSKSSPEEDVYNVLQQIALSGLQALSAHELLVQLSAKTGHKISLIKSEYRRISKGSQLSVSDAAVLLAELTYTIEYNWHLRTNPDGTCWRYTGTHWVSVSDTVLRSALTRQYRLSPLTFGHTCARVAGEAFSILKTLDVGQADISTLAADRTRVINCTNGDLRLSVEGAHLRPHFAGSGLIHTPVVAYDPSATCPKFQNALGEMFKGAKDPAGLARHVFELYGWALSGDRHIPTIWFLHGAGANGKSSVLKVLRALVGPAQVFSNSISLLAKDRFILPELSGKRLWVDDDVTANTALDDGKLKVMSGAEPITARRYRGSTSMTFICRALPVMAGNNVPRIDDASGGFERRLMVIPFARKFGPGEAHHGLFDEIIAEELPGILNEAIKGWMRVNERGGFEEPADCVDAKAMFLRNANPLRAYAEERLEAGPGHYFPVKLIWVDLCAWASLSNVKVPCTRYQLKGQLEAMGLDLVKHVGEWCVKERVLAGL